MRISNLWIPLYLFACLVLGGASNAGFLANALLQLAGAILIGWALWKPVDSPLQERARPLYSLLVAVVLLVLLQFVPVPEALWEVSPGRAELAAEAAAIGIAYKPLLWALSPYEALMSAVWLMPAIALALALLRLPNWQPQHLAWAIIAGMVLSVILGAVQLGQGQSSPAYFYTNTNRGSTVGFFANSNHLATLLLASIPFIAALTGQHLNTGREQYRLPVVLVSIGLMIVALFGIAVNGSLAGFSLIGPVLAASAMILVTRSSVRRAALVLLPFVLAGGLGWMLLTDEGAKLLVFEDMESSAGSRQEIWQTTARAISDHMPMGSGLGTFAEVYRRYENPTDVADFYINHAHNDYLELLLELGIVALPVFLVFLFWWARILVRVWLSEGGNPFAFAGAIVSGTILIHSIVDYPLRTAAISSVFAVSLCLMILSRRFSGRAGTA
ncbi:MAG: O-antigen ligase family protein [Erythrobacter sp.]|jgi:O-antigen ligase|nr:O-antigen ligase family protein [Erythrobacter sp.]